MNTRKILVVLACAAILAAVLACDIPGNLLGGAKVSNIHLATDPSGQTATSSYAPGDAFFVYADLSGLSKGSVVEAKWYAVNAQGVQQNQLINTSDYSYEPGVGHVYFQLTSSDGSDWPTGSYRVELYLDGARVGEQAFTVQ